MKTLLITLITVGMSLATLAAEPTATPVPTQSQVVGNKLQDAMADAITSTVQAMGDAKKFVVAQMPDVIKQLLVWKFYENLVPMTFFFILASWMGVLVANLIKRGDLHVGEGYHREVCPKNGYPSMIFGVVKVFIGILCLITFLLEMNLTWLQIAVAPKVYLIEYAKSFVTHK